ncbi:AzlD domain-containing protein [Paraburkholderia caribensis]|uniref:AzlD domain-containing protein n=1 Tax=Paraburkholderia caribensis TaxID=75105 RepID=A0A9Q6S9T3_9BURK|nr:AzlD domain-containing protein [Paraburkholderia caribensis]MCO4880572.1 AzlD domain-containing protein [Paraburkholderia caribensis]MDR6384445.1 branched-subunit amino acid transport protein AzlD [Paraburkholderia caribensis]PTB26176.1 AzlD domain-containing protein [Paraburkholderia caribensis]QLB67314.1 branched-chain amino acid ABC transporter [Paraburkholderia caribensis]
MGTIDNWLAVGIMSALTVFLRALPLVMHRSVLRSPWMTTINFELPMCVMVILVMHSVIGSRAAAPISAQVVALVAVALTYIRWRNSLVSVGIGLALLAVISRYFSQG